MNETNAIPTELGTDRISRLLKRYALPAIIAMTASSLYNMVDSIFIGRGCGALAISGLAVTFPLMNLSTAFGTLVGVGGQTLISVLLGQKNYDASNKVLGNIVSLNIIIGILFSIVALIFLDPILYFFGASENTLPYAREYMEIILYGNVFTHLYFGLNGALRASGNPKLAMGLTLFTVIFNSILDPVFIFVFDMGIRGAAIATVLVQVMALGYAFYFFARKSRGIHFEKGIVRLDLRVAKNSIAIGFGPFLMNVASCMVSLFINQQLIKYVGDLGVGAYGICNRISFMFLMICMGLNQGMQPIASFNYGARKYARVKEVYIHTAIWATLVCTIGFVCCMFFPKAVCSIFTHDPQLMDMSAKALRAMNCMLLVIGFQMVGTNLFQCLGMVKKSIFLSLVRQLLFYIPCLYIFPLFWGDKGIWWSFPVSDFLAAVMTLAFLLRLFRKFSRMNDGDDPSVLGGAI